MCLGAHEKIIMNWKERAEAERSPMNWKERS